MWFRRLGEGKEERKMAVVGGDAEKSDKRPRLSDGL
jgi:hypothetical protein